MPGITDKQEALIAYLADGKFHSGESLAHEMRVSRTAIWKRISTLSELGLDVYSVRGKGHRLSQPLDLLDKSLICEQLDNNSGVSLEVLSVTESTNRYLFNRTIQTPNHATVALAEYQQAGKGRRGNTWVSPYAAGLCLSMAWHFDSSPASLMSLSLATGVAVCRSLKRLGLNTVGLKWPNDIISDRKKLGGILLESKSESAGASDVVIGVGLNVNLPGDVVEELDQAITDITRIGGEHISRNQLAASIIDDLVNMLREYQTNGFKSFINDWRDYDELAGRQGELILPREKLKGKILGIDDSGLLMMSIDGKTRTFSSGEVSLRLS